MKISLTFGAIGAVALISVLLLTFQAGRQHYVYTGPFVPALPLSKAADTDSKRELLKQLDSLVFDHTVLSSEMETYKLFEWIYDIGIYDYDHEFSQTYAESILMFMFQNLGTTDKYYVEFGTENGDQTNTRFMRERLGWKGLLMDGGFENPSINLRKEMMTKSNINSLFEKHAVPHEFDLLSVDLDYNTYWVLKALSLKKYRPRVLIVEYTAAWSWSVDAPMISTEDCETCMWDYSEYQGASASAIAQLSRNKGYTMVYMENTRVNMYFIRTDILGGQEIADRMFPYKRMFRWNGLGFNFNKSPKKPVAVDGKED